MKQAKDCPDDSALVNFLINSDEKDKMTLDEIKNLCLELLFAGHETTSSAACTLVLHLAKHPDIVRKVKDELETLGLDSPGCGSDLDFQLLNKMTYVTNVVREALRLVPPVGAGFRRALKTFEIDVSVPCFCNRCKENPYLFDADVYVRNANIGISFILTTTPKGPVF